MYFSTGREVRPENNTFKAVTCYRDAYRIRKRLRLRTACESAQSGFSLAVRIFIVGILRNLQTKIEGFK